MNRLEELSRLKQYYREHRQITFEMMTSNIDERILRERRSKENEMRQRIKELETKRRLPNTNGSNRTYKNWPLHNATNNNTCKRCT